MTDTNQLPEPELGYIKTDKSNQPAFSARQMREMIDTNQLPPHTITIRDHPEPHIMQWSDLELAAIKKYAECYALQARAQVQGEACPTCGETEPYTGSCGTSNNDTKALCKQPAQATQAEVTGGIRPEDFTVDVVVKPMGGFAPVNTQGVRVTHNPTGISVTCDVARSQHANRNQAFEKLCTILALRPERVPMTDEQIRSMCKQGWVFETVRQWVHVIEAHHGITTQAKKETP